jgi:stage II sporulation protein D
MKKILFYVIALFCIVFLIPSICTKTKRQAQTKDNIENVEETKSTENNDTSTYPKYNYSNFATIKLYHSKTGEIEELPIDEYLYGVVSAEMPVKYDIEALKAQAVVARTYTIYQITHSNGKHGDTDICDNYACCQAWISKEDRFAKWEKKEAEDNWQKIVNAVDSTQGKVITYSGEVIDAFFHSNSGGITETASNVWGGQNFPYLQSVETSGEDEYSEYNSEVEISKEELINKIRKKHSEIEINYDEQDSIKIIELTESGRVKTIKLGNIEIAGTELRTLLGLKSTNFSFEIRDNSVIFFVKGYGHGVGMSQTGADSLAKQGINYEDIIKHFYYNVQIVDI